MTQVKQRLEALTTLRFFAASLIVIGHSDVIFGPFAAPRAAPFNQGVSFFFVLSGFILTWNYPALVNWQERRHFLVARFARIWPLHFATCLLWIAIVFNFDRSIYFPGVDGLFKLLANLFLVQAWIPAHHWALSFNGVSWSISTELFFYLMFPLLIALWQKRWHQIFLMQASTILTIILLATIYAIPGESKDGKISLLTVLYFTPVVRILEFTVGIALAFAVRRVALIDPQFSRRQWLSLELVTVFIMTISMLTASNLAGIRQTLGDSATFYFTSSGLCLFWALLIGVFAVSRGPIRDIFSLRVAVFLGEISFSLYLCHAIVINYLENYKEHVQPYGTTGYAIFWMWCLLFAAILFIGIETPFRKFVLAITSKKPSSKHAWLAVRVCFGFKEVFAIGVLISMALAMMFLRPSTIVTLDDAKVTQFMQSTAVSFDLSGGVIFNDKYEILGMRLQAPSRDKDIAEILVLMRVKEALRATDTLALHTIGADGQMTGGFDRRLDKGRLEIPAGTRWIQKFEIPTAKLDQSSSFGLAMYTTPDKLFDALGGNRDWGGKRLILSIKR